MQSTKDESGWGLRIGGGFARVHHSIYQRKRAQQNGIEDDGDIADVSSSLQLFSTSKKNSYSRSITEAFNNVGYNMQFLRHDSQKNWEDDGMGANDKVGHTQFLEEESVKGSSFW